MTSCVLESKWSLLRLYTNPERTLSPVLLLLLHLASVLTSPRGDWGLRSCALTYFIIPTGIIRMFWRGSYSSPHSFTAGVPQGSVLGPLLYFLCIKSPGSAIRSNGLYYQRFSDDTQLLLTSRSSTKQDSRRLWMKELKLEKFDSIDIPARNRSPCWTCQSPTA